MEPANSNRPLPPTEAQVLTVAEMCATFRISKNRVFSEMKAGRLQAKRLGGRVLISRDDAATWWNGLPDRRAA
ncbi:helix-turn-helix domain-containing protein [Methylobacterium sp. NMS12]|uniref:helix-turn-helix domain-containing protein n=1 Tax=Methylobacterium sp. NMS12 TaxID=3079766 RepID=UPI003F880A1A